MTPRGPDTSTALRSALGLGFLLVLCALLGGCNTPELPESWPRNLPLYPGSILTSSTEKEVAGGAGKGRQEFLRIELDTLDEPQAVLRFYAETANTARYIEDQSVLSNTRRGYWTAAYTKDQQLLEVSSWIVERSNEGVVQLMTKVRLTLYLPLEKAG